MLVGPLLMTRPVYILVPLVKMTCPIVVDIYLAIYLHSVKKKRKIAENDLKSTLLFTLPRFDQAYEDSMSRATAALRYVCDVLKSWVHRL